MNDGKSALKISLIAILTAVTVVFTLLVRIPTTKGYLNLCDVAIFFSAFSFGPAAGFLSGALGTALADIIGGYAQWAPISFLAHGLEGLLVALIVRKSSSQVLHVVALVIGVITVCLLYYVLGGTFLSGYPAALAEVPGNLIQSTIGAILGLAISKAVVKAYPPVKGLKD